MSKIKKGDLVMVVRKWCCEDYFRQASTVGVPWTVVRIFTHRVECPVCGQSAITQVAEQDRDYFSVVSCLIKIDPPSTGEYDRVPQRLKEPA